MREIKFRAWQPKTKKWIPWADWGNATDHFATGYENGTFALHGHPDFCVYSQYTGLEDVEGKEIYEGDLLCSKLLLKELKIRKKKSVYVTEVTWSDEMDYAGFNISTDEIKCTEYVIVGNIYENKELLV